MKTPLLSLHSKEHGQTLVAALVVITLTVTIAGMAARRTAGSARVSARASDFSETERAADGIIEYAFGVWKTATLNKGSALGFNGGSLTPSELTALTSGGTMTGFNNADSEGALTIRLVDYLGREVTAPPGRLQVVLPDYPGWRGYAYNYLATVRLTPAGGISATKAKAGARRLFQYTEVPLFQSMYFYEHDLEIYRPAPMIVSGLTHSNSRLLLSGSSDKTGVELNFQSNVSYAGGTVTTPGYAPTEPPIGGPQWAFGSSDIPYAQARMESPTFSAGGESAQLSKVGRYEPLGNRPAAVLNTTDTNPNNDTMRELIEPPVAGHTDPVDIQKRRLYTKAGVIVTVNGATITAGNRATVIGITTQNGTTLTAAQQTSIRNAMTKGTFYDMREGKNVDTVNIDVSLVTPVLNAAAGFNGVFYVHDITASVSGDTEPRTIRLKKGGTLPNVGLTVASQNPVYVQGDYNTGTTTSPTSVPANSTGNPNNTDSPVVSGYTRKPSAVIADAVMFLSNAWNDSNASNTDLDTRIASNTTYNTAIMAGFMPSGYDPVGSAGPYGYSGGANNFPRFLEKWTDKSCTYFGSMVELFQSTVFTGEWDTGNIYNPPSRRWNYDTLFSTTPPPGSVDAVVISRGTWARL